MQARNREKLEQVKRKNHLMPFIKALRSLSDLNLHEEAPKAHFLRRALRVTSDITLKQLNGCGRVINTGYKLLATKLITLEFSEQDDSAFDNLWDWMREGLLPKNEHDTTALRILNTVLKHLLNSRAIASCQLFNPSRFIKALMETKMSAHEVEETIRVVNFFWQNGEELLQLLIELIDANLALKLDFVTVDQLRAYKAIYRENPYKINKLSRLTDEELKSLNTRISELAKNLSTNLDKLSDLDRVLSPQFSHARLRELLAPFIGTNSLNKELGHFDLIRDLRENVLPKLNLNLETIGAEIARREQSLAATHEAKKAVQCKEIKAEWRKLAAQEPQTATEVTTHTAQELKATVAYSVLPSPSKASKRKLTSKLNVMRYEIPKVKANIIKKTQETQTKLAMKACTPSRQRAKSIKVPKPSNKPILSTGQILFRAAVVGLVIGLVVAGVYAAGIIFGVTAITATLGFVGSLVKAALGYQIAINIGTYLAGGALVTTVLTGLAKGLVGLFKGPSAPVDTSTEQTGVQPNTGMIDISATSSHSKGAAEEQDFSRVLGDSDTPGGPPTNGETPPEHPSAYVKAAGH